MKKLLFLGVVLVLVLAMLPAAVAAADPPAELVGLWHFDEGSDDTAADSGAAPANNGQLGSTTGADVNDPTWVDGKFGKALFFDGNDYVVVADDSSLDITGAITIEAWIYSTDVGSGVGAYRCIAAKRYGNFANYALRLDDGGKLDFYYSGPSATSSTTDWNVWHTNNRVISANSWYHVAVTFTFAGGPIAAYVNGSSVSGAWYAGGPSDPATANDYTLRIGMAYPSYAQYFKGLIDEVRIWNRALSAEKIAFNYSLGNVAIDIKPGSDPNCIKSDEHGVIPVAMLGSAVFDAATVNPSTVTLDGAEVRVKGKSGNAGSLEDVNGDGYQDLVVQIIDDGGYSAGDTQATLTGYTYGGLPLVGSDAICIVPPE